MNLKHNREKVIETGLNLFCSKGYSNLGIDEICKTTGMTKGAFYNAFKSKEQFLLTTITAYGEITINHLNKKLNHNKNKAIDRLLGMYENMFDMQPGNNYTGCMINNIMSELGSTNEIVSKATAIEFERFLSIIEPVVAEAQKDGDIINSVNSLAITELLHSTFYGALTRAKSTREFNHGKETMTLLINSLKQK
ncbi:MAG: TetR/AcrR family transcriptional regulator [Saprospiraceae bacterium]|nr:TetR/AcrR family transcriptional regulator [Saprospiraceae bacterium]MCB9326543.1 TetR/AcrR family transcriptional regulator [Lewinellaceae bacterium]